MMGTKISSDNTSKRKIGLTHCANLLFILLGSDFANVNPNNVGFISKL